MLFVAFAFGFCASINYLFALDTQTQCFEMKWFEQQQQLKDDNFQKVPQFSGIFAKDVSAHNSEIGSKIKVLFITCRQQDSIASSSSGETLRKTIPAMAKSFGAWMFEERMIAAPNSKNESFYITSAALASADGDELIKEVKKTIDYTAGNNKKFAVFLCFIGKCAPELCRALHEKKIIANSLVSQITSCSVVFIDPTVPNDKDLLNLPASWRLYNFYTKARFAMTRKIQGRAFIVPLENEKKGVRMQVANVLVVDGIGAWTNKFDLRCAKEEIFYRFGAIAKDIALHYRVNNDLAAYVYHNANKNLTSSVCINRQTEIAKMDNYHVYLANKKEKWLWDVNESYFTQSENYKMSQDYCKQDWIVEAWLQAEQKYNKLQLDGIKQAAT